MVDVLAQYPAVQEYLDDSEQFHNTASEVISRDQSRFLIVTQIGASVAGQLLFSISADGTLVFITGDTEVDPDNLATIAAVVSNSYSVSSEADHVLVANEMVAEAGKFSSAGGPDGGTLACVWAMRQIVSAALSREITHTDSTNTLVEELTSGFDKQDGFAESDVPPGGIIVSPGATAPGTKKWRHGHVGLMGARLGGERVVYSNSSQQALWVKNGTVESWLADHSGLRTYYFPIPNGGGPI